MLIIHPQTQGHIANSHNLVTRNRNDLILRDALENIVYCNYTSDEEHSNLDQETRTQWRLVASQFFVAILSCSIYLFGLPYTLPWNTPTLVEELLGNAQVCAKLAEVLSPRSNLFTHQMMMELFGQALVNSSKPKDVGRLVAALEPLAMPFRSAVRKMPAPLNPPRVHWKRPNNFDEAWVATLTSISHISAPDIAEVQPIIDDFERLSSRHLASNVGLVLLRFLSARFFCINKGLSARLNDTRNFRGLYTRLNNTHVLAALHEKWFPRDEEILGWVESDGWNRKVLRRNLLLFRIMRTYSQSGRFRWTALIRSWDGVMGYLVRPTFVVMDTGFSSIEGSQSSIIVGPFRDPHSRHQMNDIPRRQPHKRRQEYAESEAFDIDDRQPKKRRTEKDEPSWWSILILSVRTVARRVFRS